METRTNWISTKDKLPEVGKYVLARHNRGTWIDGDDQDNVNCVVVKLKRGLSIKEREATKGTNKDYQDRFAGGLRSDTYKFGDEEGNNTVPWAWNAFGPDSFFGQTITHWTPIEPLTI